MSIRTGRWPAGVPCWADLSAPDVDAACERYARALGWEFERSEPGSEYGGYVLAQRRGASAAGVGPLPSGAAPTWTLYFATDDVDVTVPSISDAGGEILAGPYDVGSAGRMALAQDSTGAAFGVWQAKEHIGAGLVNEPGGLVWEDLRSPDPDAARAFYGRVFGFRFAEVPGSGMDGYTTFSLDDGVPLGGIGPTLGAPAPHWLVYFAVEDAESAVASLSLGGSVLLPPQDTPYGRLGVVADASGAVVALMQTTGDRTPDRSA